MELKSTFLNMVFTLALIIFCPLFLPETLNCRKIPRKAQMKPIVLMSKKTKLIVLMTGA